MGKLLTIASIVFSIAFLFTVSAVAQQNLVETVANGCKEEINTFCGDVLPGEGRILACFYARSDKLSGKCEYALYDAAVQLERAVAALAYLVNECAGDLKKLCQDVPAGQGRLLECLRKNETEVTTRCKDAIKEVGME